MNLRHCLPIALMFIGCAVDQVESTGESSSSWFLDRHDPRAQISPELRNVPEEPAREGDGTTVSSKTEVAVKDLETGESWQEAAKTDADTESEPAFQGNAPVGGLGNAALPSGVQREAATSNTIVSDTSAWPWRGVVKI